MDEMAPFRPPRGGSQMPRRACLLGGDMPGVAQEEAAGTVAQPGGSPTERHHTPSPENTGPGLPELPMFQENSDTCIFM